MVDVIMDRNYVVINLFQNTFILRRFRAANFANIVKIATMLIKTTSKDSVKVKGIGNYVLKCNVYLRFQILPKLLISGEKILTSPELTGLNCQI